DSQGAASRIVWSRRSGSPAPIRAVQRYSDAHDVIVDFWKPPWAERAPSKGWSFENQLHRRAAFHPAGSIELWLHKAFRGKSYWSAPNIGLVALAIVQPSSVAVARPVLQRHRSIANCRASATAIFFLSDAPTLSFSKYFWRACQLGCQRN